MAILQEVFRLASRVSRQASAGKIRQRCFMLAHA